MPKRFASPKIQKITKIWGLTYGESYVIKSYRNADKKDAANEWTISHPRINGRIDGLAQSNKRLNGDDCGDDDAEFAHIKV